MSDNVRTVIFASVLAFVCSLVLATVSRFTGPYRKANERAEEVRNFLQALEVPVDPDAGSEALLDVFSRNVQTRELDQLSLYEYLPEGADADQPVAVAVPFSGAGLWGPIKGVLALERDLITIRGIRFYQQEETPGLGGEIGSDWFTSQFRGKKMVSDSGTPGFNIIKPGSEPDDNSVDGITGATMTSDRVRLMLNDLAMVLSEGRSGHGE